MTERFVSSTGSGSTYSRVSPGHCAGAIAASSGDDFITMLSGTYTGANYMLDCSSKSGTSGHPITIRADVDGGVFVNGQSVRHAVHLDASSYWTILGINAGNLDATSTDGVFTLDHASKHNIFRRCIGWNSGNTTNSQVWQVDNSSDFNLFEDCAGFGTGRKMFSVFLSLNNTFRRCWGMFSTNTSTAGPQQTFTNYSSYNTIFENCIGTWDVAGIGFNNPYGVLGAFQMTGASAIPGGPGTIVSNSIYNGCIAYYFASQSGFFYEGGVFGGPFVDGITFNNCAVYVEKTGGDASPTAHLYNLTVVAEFGNTIPATAHVISNFSGINFDTNFEPLPTTTSYSFIEADWTQTNVKHGLTVASIYTGGESLYVNNGSKGATILYRTVDGVLQTGTSLWPWPMTQRIVDAMTLEGTLAVRDVDEDIQAIFGVPPTIIPGAVSPVDTFNTYSAGADLAGDNGGTNWVGAWATDGGAAMTTENAPSGFSGKTVKSIGAGSVTYYYRQCQGVSSDSFKWAMMSTVANPNDDFCGVSLHESGVNIRTQVQFSSGGNIRAYDYDAVAWVDVLAGFSANVRYNLELAVDTTNHPDQYRVRVNSGTWTAWLGVNGSLSVLNLFQINNFTSNATLWLDDIGSTGSGSLTNPVLAYTSLTEGVLTT